MPPIKPPIPIPTHPKKLVMLIARAASRAPTIIRVHINRLDITPEYVKPKKIATK